MTPIKSPPIAAPTNHQYQFEDVIYVVIHVAVYPCTNRCKTY